LFLRVVYVPTFRINRYFIFLVAVGLLVFSWYWIYIHFRNLSHSLE